MRLYDRDLQPVAKAIARSTALSKPGWVEHDPVEIAQTAIELVRQVLHATVLTSRLGINQRRPWWSGTPGQAAHERHCMAVPYRGGRAQAQDADLSPSSATHGPGGRRVLFGPQLAWIWTVHGARGPRQRAGTSRHYRHVVDRISRAGLTYPARPRDDHQCLAHHSIAWTSAPGT